MLTLSPTQHAVRTLNTQGTINLMARIFKTKPAVIASQLLGPRKNRAGSKLVGRR